MSISKREVKIISVIVKTVIPFIIPLLFYVPESHLSDSAKWAITIVILVIDGILYFFLERNKKGEDTETFKNKAARIAYSHFYELNELKRDYYIDHVADIESNQIYDAVKYLKGLSYSFRDVIGEITSIEKENMHSTFIYKLKETDEWCWATQRESTFKRSPKELFAHTDSVFYQLMNSNENGNYKTFVFYNDKGGNGKKGTLPHGNP